MNNVIELEHSLTYWNETTDTETELEVLVRVISYSPKVNGVYYNIPEECYPDEEEEIEYELVMADSTNEVHNLMLKQLLADEDTKEEIHDEVMLLISSVFKHLADDDDNED